MSNYNAISIDTSIFIKNGLTLDKGLLKRLDQFSDSRIDVIIPDIILNEIKKHLEEDNFKRHQAISKTIKEFRKYFDIDENINTVFNTIERDISPQNETNKKINDFIKRTNIEILKSEELLDIKKLIELYFDSTPPFSENIKKKNEFPDAIALLSLQSWAEEYNKKIIAVSTDNDWVKFAEDSDKIDVTDNLADAISMLQSQIDPDTLLNSLAALIESNYNDIYSKLKEKASDYTNDLDIYPEADSEFHYDYDFIEIYFESMSLNEGPDGKPLLTLIDSENDNMVVVQSKMKVSATANCDFNLFVHDSIDKDYVSIGQSSKEVSFEYDTDVLISFIGDFENTSDITDIDIDDIEFLSSPKDINFGYLELNHTGDYE